MACRSACRSSARNTAITPASSSPSSWTRNIAASCHHRAIKGDRHDEPALPDLKVPVVDQIFWAGYSGMSYLPASAAPIGRSSDGLPIGVQIVGPQYGDYTCIQFAKLLDQEYRSFVPPPGYQG